MYLYIVNFISFFVYNFCQTSFNKFNSYLSRFNLIRCQFIYPDLFKAYNSAYSMLRIQHFSQLHFLFTFKNEGVIPPPQLFGSFKKEFTEIIDIDIRLKIQGLSLLPSSFPTHPHTTNCDFKNWQFVLAESCTVPYICISEDAIYPKSSTTHLRKNHSISMHCHIKPTH